MATSDKNLIEAIRKGDRVAMKQLYDRFIGSLSFVCSRYVSDNEEVKDILHDSFIKIYSSIGKFRWQGEGSLKAWMTKIVINESLKHLKAKDKSPLKTYGEIPQDIPEEDADPEKIPLDVLLEFIRELPPGYRAVFNLVVFDGYSHKQAAAELGISESTSASQFHRAKAILAKRINEYGRLEQ